MEKSSKLGVLPVVKWSPERAVKYEVALDALGLVVARLTALLAAERERSGPDATAVEELLSKRARVIAVQRSLRADDSDGIQKAITDSVDMLRTLPDPAA